MRKLTAFQRAAWKHGQRAGPAASQERQFKAKAKVGWSFEINFLFCFY